MNPTRIPSLSSTVSLSTALLAAFAALSASGADITWNNASGGNWSAAGNWNPNTVPTEAGANAVFFGDNAGTFSAPITVTVDALDQGATSIAFSGSANYTIASAATTTQFLRMAGFAQQISSTGTGAHQITARTNVGSRFGNAEFTATNSSTGTLTFGDTIRVLGDSTSRVHTLTFGGSGNISVGAIANAGSQSYTSTIVKTGAGTLTFRSTTLTGTTNGIRVDQGNVSFNLSAQTFATAITGDGGVVHSQGGRVTLTGANTYKGGTRIQGVDRVLAIASDGNLGDSAGGVTFASDAGGGSPVLRIEGTGAFATARDFAIEAGTSGVLAMGATAGRTATFTGDISGAGNLVLGTGGTLGGVSGDYVIAGAATHLGDTRIFASVDGTNKASLLLAESGSLTFRLGESGVGNRVSGVPGGGTGANAPTATFAGTFNFDLSGAATTPGASWTVVDLATLNPLSSFTGTFNVLGFTESDNVWTSGVYQFSELTGVLSVAAIPEPAAAAALGGLLALGAVVSRRRRG